MPVGRTPSSAGGNGQSDPKVGFAAAPFVSELGRVVRPADAPTTAYAANVEPQRRPAEVRVARSDTGDPRWRGGQSYHPQQNGQYYYLRQNGQYYYQR